MGAANEIWLSNNNNNKFCLWCFLNLYFDQQKHFSTEGGIGLSNAEAASDRLRFCSWSSAYMKFLCSVSLGLFR